jgi:hypothetical protein
MFSERFNVQRRSVERRSVQRRSRNEEDPQFVIAVDFGLVRDFTALAVAERVKPPDDGAADRMSSHAAERFHVRELKRFPLRTQSPEIIDFICQLMARPWLGGRCGLIVDASGAGLPIVQEMRRRGLRPVAITITGGDRINGNHVPKRDLLSRLSLLFQQSRLRISPYIRFRAELMEEFENFTIKFTANGKSTYSAASGAHDDLIMALCLACHFFAYRRGTPRVRATVIGSQVGRLDMGQMRENRMLNRWLRL